MDLTLNINQNTTTRIQTGWGILGKLGEEISRIKPYKIAIITDKIVSRLWLDKVLEHIKGDVILNILPPGENSKDINVAIKVWNHLIENSFTRKSLIIGLGGGTVCDISGYIAATFMRGVPLMLIPTTLLAQVDASIGGKNGVNLHGKNLVGTFYQPKSVIIDHNFIYTLDRKEFLNGISEIIKYGIIWDKELYNYLALNSKGLLERNEARLSWVIEKSIKAKAHVVSIDPYETGLRRILNFGHTIGHAIEVVSNYSVSHGVAVAIGMIVESLVAKEEVGFDKADDIRNLVKSFTLPTTLNITPKEIISLLSSDKKAWYGDVIMILPKEIGKALITSVPIEKVELALMRVVS
jgi:3-dehydroquinate synthase